MREKLISELLDLPEKVRKGDFVLNLSKGITEPDKTLEQYIVTPQLVACFDDALGFIRQSVDSVSSKACYLHGSFGAGKSHSMAVLHLLLQHNPAVRNIADLAKLFDAHKKDNHCWVENKKFLPVPYHMIGARNMESAILGGYVDHVMELHPRAPLPGVYGDYDSPDGLGCPASVELYGGRLRIVVFGDINSEDPTNIIDLTGAAEISNTRYPIIKEATKR